MSVRMTGGGGGSICSTADMFGIIKINEKQERRENSEEGRRSDERDKLS